jgi:hypothetical protein
MMIRRSIRLAVIRILEAAPVALLARCGGATSCSITSRNPEPPTRED